MSNTLKDQFDEKDVLDQFAEKAVYVVIDRRINGQQRPLSCLLRSVLFDVDPELEVRIELSEALLTVKAENLSIAGFELHHGDIIVPVPGPFNVKAARIDDIDVIQQSCVLALLVQRKKLIISSMKMILDIKVIIDRLNVFITRYFNMTL